MTYGDDVKGSVKKGYDWFNHISYANFLKERDMIFTMPDKESTPTMYMRDEEADFLKRRNIFNEDTGLLHGALDEASCFKMLHTAMESTSDSMDELACKNIDNALREWWQYGREHYEMRREQMKEVVAAHTLGKIDMLNKSYDVYLKEWTKKYIDKPDDEVPLDESTFVRTDGNEWQFDTQC
jgi:hypothetical protein